MKLKKRKRKKITTPRVPDKYNGKGWEATFLIRAVGLSEELSIKVCFAFSNNGLKSQDLQFRMTFFCDIFYNVLSRNSYHTFGIPVP